MLECVCLDSLGSCGFQFLMLLPFLKLVQASQSMDPTESQVPSMEEHGLQSELPVVEIEAIDDGLQGEVIALHNDLFVCMCMPM